ncbi:protein kinase, partial [Emiliania huxleyi CCMP1516]|uniref:non-specific serine/threonine protein kinase n=2 Tax=Emiliania huxleyi TaxID=2903 RepID=A0A0D3JE47_EMIH1
LAARLGRGSFGTTYRMRKVAGIDARRYAVKMIESEELDGAGLEKEARLLSMIEHENTLRFYDAFWHDSEDGRLFVIVTELLTGGSLAEKIAAAPPLHPPEVATLMQQVASGLAYMHSLNLQHRDLKPANVMLDATGRAKIIDFGLACVSSASRSRTKTKAVGTDAYMSPEKADGKRYGPPDDVWAAGCILAELLLGR